MRKVNIHEAKTHLSRLVEEAARGEPFVIAEAGKPLVKVVPLEPEKVDTSKRMGFLRHANWTVPDDFDTFMQDEIIATFYGEDEGGEEKG